MEDDAGRMARNERIGKSERVENLSYDEWYRRYVNIVDERSDKAYNKYKRFYSDKSLNNHFLKHSSDYPDFNVKEYLNRAIELLNSDISDVVLGFDSEDGFVYRYDIITNDLVIGKKDKYISTLFKPERGRDYYNEQFKKYKK